MPPKVLVPPEAPAVFFCELKGVAHAPAFRVHSTELERVAEAWAV
jgi:hypothetical protein